MAVNEKNEYVFTWMIENYSACYKEKDEKLSSPVFKIENLFGSVWIIDFYPNGHSSQGDYEYEREISCYLRWVESDEYIENIDVSFSFNILNEDSSILHEEDFEYDMVKDKAYGSDEFYPVDDLAEEMADFEEDILILQCRITSDLLKRPSLKLGSEACTKNGVDRCSADWDVKLPLLMEYSESIFLPLSALNQFEATLVSDLDSVKIYFQFKKELCDLPLRITFKITMFDKIDCKLKSTRAVHIFESSEKWQFPNIITKKLLESCKIDSSRCEFRLLCDACIWNKSVSAHSINKFKSNFASKEIPKIETGLQKEFRDLFLGKRYSDITFRALTEEFPAHKFILKVRSPVLAAMFEQNMLENQTGVVDITDMDGKALKAFLQFLYTDILDEMDYDLAKSLLLAGDKYQVPSLVDECASFLKSSMSVEKVCEVVMIADLINCEVLKSSAVHFIKANAEKILPTDAWTKLIEGNAKLATLILSELSLLIHPKYKFR